MQMANGKIMLPNGQMNANACNAARRARPGQNARLASGRQMARGGQARPGPGRGPAARASARII